MENKKKQTGVTPKSVESKVKNAGKFNGKFGAVASSPKPKPTPRGKPKK